MMMSGIQSYKIVPATLADADVVTAILTATYEKQFANWYDRDVLNVALPLMTKAHPGLLGSGHYFLARTADGRAIGCGGWSRDEPGTGKTVEGLAHVRHFATHPDWSRRGAGRAILSHCLVQATEANCEKLLCFAALGSEPFYTALNFVRINAVEIPLPGGIRFPAVVMQWSADQQGVEN